MALRRSIALCLLLAACATEPDLPDISPTKPVVMGAHGPLTDRQVKALFAKLGPAQDTLQRHLAVEQAVAPLYAGNHTRVLENGPVTFEMMFEFIRSARDHVNLEYFIMEDVKVGSLTLGATCPGAIPI